MGRMIKCTMRAALVSLLVLGAGCTGGEKPSSAAERMLAEAPKSDAERVGYLLHDRGLLHNAEVQAKQNELLFAANSRQMSSDSATRAFRGWLDEWVKTHPGEAEAAQASRPVPLTAEEQRAEAERVRQRRPAPLPGETRGAPVPPPIKP